MPPPTAAPAAAPITVPSTRLPLPATRLPSTTPVTEPTTAPIAVLFADCVPSAWVVQPASSRPRARYAVLRIMTFRNPDLMIEGAGSPHSYALRPSEARALDQAEVVFWVGEGLEAFLAKPLGALSDDATVVELADAKGLRLLSTREGGAWEGHEEEEHGHEHEEDDH